MSNLYDVAKLAGVSKTLVSRVINNQKGVGDESRKKINAAMAELNYIPNGTARALVTGKTSIIGIILDSLCEPYFFDLVKGIEQEIEQSNYRVIFCSGHNNAKTKEQYIDFFSSGRTDGVIIYGSNYDDNELFLNISNSNFPIAVVESEVTDGNVNNVIVENEYGSSLIVKHLYEKGCRNIQHITGAGQNKVALSRQAGYEKTMKAYGLEARTIDCGYFQVKYGYDAMKQYLKELKNAKLPDAIYFGADVLAYGGMMVLQEEGIKIPEDIKIAGFDDDSSLHYGLDNKFIGLTTIRQPLYQMGTEAVKLLIRQIHNPAMTREKRVFYPELIVRESTG